MAKLFYDVSVPPPYFSYMYVFPLPPVVFMIPLLYQWNCLWVHDVTLQRTCGRSVLFFTSPSHLPRDLPGDRVLSPQLGAPGQRYWPDWLGLQTPNWEFPALGQLVSWVSALPGQTPGALQVLCKSRPSKLNIAGANKSSFPELHFVN